MDQALFKPVKLIVSRVCGSGSSSTVTDKKLKETIMVVY